MVCIYVLQGTIVYCIAGNFSDVETLANLTINSFLLKLQVANLVLHCNTGTSIKVCTTKNAKSLNKTSQSADIWKTLKLLIARITRYTVPKCVELWDELHEEAAS